MGINRIELKEEAKAKLKGHWGQAILVSLSLPIFIVLWEVFTILLSLFLVAIKASILYDLLSVIFFFGMPWAVMAIAFGVNYAYLDFFRNPNEKQNPLLRCVRVYQQSGLLSGTFALAILTSMWLFFWEILFYFPAVVKSCAYSQTFFIYRDHLQLGHKIDFGQAVTESRQLMDGHKWEYFVLSLSFIGWNILGLLTLGIAYIWIVPYMKVTFAGYHEKLKEVKLLEMYGQLAAR
ncbi:DUF975 family protein [Eupransor demetentiae]|uniref:Uncharacterized membrane protein n=1 Tax=Eupransor demetentiae TaxID=3109584 RepID=A0ABP0EMZ2_9LACO|nr:Uncharacterized membrane protein [Lactobacillaceae bacterium LMG 33000]